MANEKKNSRASRYAAPIGGVFIILCLIGLVSLVGSCFQFTRNLLDNSTAKHNYDSMLLPVVMFDPPPFEDPPTLRAVDLLMYSVWAAVLGDNRDIYEYDDNASMVIPASDVDMAAYKLFGPGVTLSHSSFGDYDISYVYDESTKSYHVPVRAITGFYTPRVEDIFKKDDVIQLKVGYVPPATALNVDLSGKGQSDQKPDKYMVYELRKNKKDYYLQAVRDVEGTTYRTGSDANPILNEVLDELTGLDMVEDPKQQLEFLTPGSSSEGEASSGASEGAADGNSASGESEAASGPEGESSESSESIPAPDVEG